MTEDLLTAGKAVEVQELVCSYWQCKVAQIL